MGTIENSLWLGRFAQKRVAIRLAIRKLNEIHASLSRIPPHVTSSSHLFQWLLIVRQLRGEGNYLSEFIFVPFDEQRRSSDSRSRLIQLDVHLPFIQVRVDCRMDQLVNIIQQLVWMMRLFAKYHNFSQFARCKVAPFCDLPRFIIWDNVHFKFSLRGTIASCSRLLKLLGSNDNENSLRGKSDQKNQQKFESRI
jgi:hypothetical protein